MGNAGTTENNEEEPLPRRSSRVDFDTVVEALQAEFSIERDVIETVVRQFAGNYTKSHDTIASLIRMERDRELRLQQRKAGLKGGRSGRKTRKGKSASAKQLRRERSKAEVQKYKRLRKLRRKQGATDEHIQKEIATDMRSKLEAVGRASEVRVMNPPRSRKRLLVMDMDYTMFDHQSDGSPKDNERPYLHHLLKSVYPHYDIVVWSQTHAQRLRAILESLNVYANPEFRLVFVLDSSCMYHVTHEGPDGKLRSHEVKDLHYIWGKWPEHYNPCNTVHVDDYEPNFAMNPDNGLPIEAFTESLRTRGRDKTLKRLTKYLLSIVDEADFSLLDLRNWKDNVGSSSSGSGSGRSTRSSSSSSSSSSTREKPAKTCTSTTSS